MMDFKKVLVSFGLFLAMLVGPRVLAQEVWTPVPNTQTAPYSARTDDGRTFTYRAQRVINAQGEAATRIRIDRSNRPGLPIIRVVRDRDCAELCPPIVGRSFIGSIFNRFRDAVKRAAQSLSRLVRTGAQSLQQLSEYFGGLAQQLFGVANELDKDFGGRYANAASQVRLLPASMPPQTRLIEAIKRTVAQDSSGKAARLWGVSVARMP